jgi:hypothetical protein
MVVTGIVAVLLAAFEAGRRWLRSLPSPGVTIPSQRYMYDDLRKIPPPDDSDMPGTMSDRFQRPRP